MKEIKFYIDLDGVLVDFNKGYYELTGKDLTGKFESGPEFWKPIDDAGYEFWINLEWTKDGKQLWEYVKKYNPQILSAPSSQIDSRIAKMNWVKRELPGTKLILRSAKHKHEFATSDSLLIDDRPENIEKWVNVGGIGILHTSAKKTINDLKKMNL